MTTLGHWGQLFVKPGLKTGFETGFPRKDHFYDQVPPPQLQGGFPCLVSFFSIIDRSKQIKAEAERKKENVQSVRRLEQMGLLFTSSKKALWWWKELPEETKKKYLNFFFPFSAKFHFDYDIIYEFLSQGVSKMSKHSGHIVSKCQCKFFLYIFPAVVNAIVINIFQRHCSSQLIFF